MADYFGEALNDFVHNFAWGGTVEHLLSKGYTIDKMISEKRVILPRKQIEELAEKINKQRELEGKERLDIR